MRVGFVASDFEGGGRVRSLWPAWALLRSGTDVVHRDVTWPEPGSVDVLIVHRPLAPSTPWNIDDQRAAGTKVLVDEDDDLTEVPANMAEKVFGDDGTGWQGAAIRHRRNIESADGLIVSTPRLAEVYGHLNERVFVCRNYLPSEIRGFRKQRPRFDQPIVQWMGMLYTHRHDLTWLAPKAEQMVFGAHMETIGDAKALRYLGVPEGAWHGFQQHPSDLYRLMGSADIGIVPLDPSYRLNLGKSWLKALEYMTVGVPVVATALPEQEALITDGRTGFLATDPADFARKVQELIRNPALRLQMGEAAYAHAETLALEWQLQQWHDVLNAFEEGA